MGSIQEVTITLQNSNNGSLSGDRRVLQKLFSTFRLKHPSSFWVMRRGNTRWDGYIKYISERGTFRIGLFPKIYHTLLEWGVKVNIKDLRLPVTIPKTVARRVGDKILYPRQIEALERLVFNKVGGVPFLIEAADLAVGFGKSILFSALHETFGRKLKTVLLLNDSDLFNQFKSEIPPMLPGEDVRFIQGSKSVWGNFNVAMVQSVSQNLKKYATDLAQVDMVLIDEADIIDNKTYKGVIERLWNTKIRIGLSGTLYMSKLKKDEIHNMNVMSFIGEKVDEVKLIDQMNTGRATPVVVKMIETSLIPTKVHVSYPDEYSEVISYNEKAYQVSLDRALFNARYGRFPMLIVTKYIDHCESLYEFYEKRLRGMGLGYKIAYVHHETKDRKRILDNFREGKIDILISTTIISRGKNFPTLKYLQNAASMDSNEKAIQILGRLVRQHADKSKAYLDDIMYNGKYLSRHAKHRKSYYKNEKLKVITVKEKKSNGDISL